MGGDLVLGRQAEGEGAEGGVERGIVGHGGERVEVGGIGAAPRVGREAGEETERVAAAGFPLVEGVAVVGQQERPLGGAVVRSRTTGAEKPRSSDGTGRVGQLPLEARGGGVELEHALGDGFAGGREEADGDRDDERAPCRAGRGWAASSGRARGRSARRPSAR